MATTNLPNYTLRLMTFQSAPRPVLKFDTSGLWGSSSYRRRVPARFIALPTKDQSQALRLDIPNRW